MKVDVLHRADLRVASPGSAALHTKHGPHRRLAQAEHHLLADLAKPLGQRDARRSLAFSRLRRRDRSDDHELGIRLLGEAVQDRESYFAAMLRALLELLRLNAGGRGDL